MRDFKLQKDYEKQIVKIYFDKITILPRYRFYQSVGHIDNLTTLEHESNSSGDGDVMHFARLVKQACVDLVSDLFVYYRQKTVNGITVPAENIKVGSAYKIDNAQPIGKEKDTKAGADEKAVPHYTLRNTLLGCFCTTLAALFLAFGQACIQVGMVSYFFYCLFISINFLCSGLNW